MQQSEPRPRRVPIWSHRRWRTVVLALPLLAGVAMAEPPGSPVAKQALVLCGQADDLAGDAQREALERGVRLADDAIAADNNDAKAHLALFCNLGKQIKVTGLGLSSFLKFRRMRREVDVTLELAPDDPDALAAKGVLLLQTPRLLGGDAAEAERLLRRALEIEPDNSAARRYLAVALEERGASSAAPALLGTRAAGVDTPAH
jgi:tetratricopeptide (TPR) repeat protein